MAHRHLDARLFDALLRGDATTEEVRELVWHLVESCPDCAQAVDSDWVLLGDPSEEDHSLACVSGGDQPPAESASPGAKADMDRMFQRLRDRMGASVRRLEDERSRAPSVVSYLLALPEARRRLVVLNDRRAHTLPVAEALIDTAAERGREDATDGDHLVQLALDAIDRIASEDVSAELLDDVRARAWGVRGNLQRILTDLRGAEAAFARARELLAKGTGDLLERARISTLEATLRRLQMRQDEAAELLDEALQIYRALDETHWVGRTLVTRAILYNELDESQAAIATLREARKLIDPERDPYLDRIAQQNLVVYLSECGHYEQARRMIPGLRSRVIENGTRPELLRLRWLEGQIHLGLGHDARAEGAYLEARKGFLELDRHYDVALISLELAALYMRQRRTGEIRELAAQMFPIFQSRDLHQQAIAALLLFQRAVEMDTLTLRMVEEVADVVRRSQEKPRLPTPEPS